MKRLIAVFLVCVFLAGVVVTSWPHLYLPSLDFVFDSLNLSREARVQQWQAPVVTLTVLARPSDSVVSRPLVQQRGTGFNIDPSGVIITNHHVVNNAVRIVVTFPDGRLYNAKGWFAEPEWDLAVVELAAASALPLLPLGDSDRMQLGEEVTIIGNPLGLEGIVIRGTLGRSLNLPGHETPVLELDAPIHPGHSGSPVIDGRGRVLGVVFGSLEADGGNRGLALPVNRVRDFLALIP